MNIPDIICPLCREKNKAFENQRCTHCKMLMISDQKFQEQNTTIRPLMEKIASALQTGSQHREIQPLLNQLAPYKDDHIIVQEYLQGVSKRIQPLIMADRLRLMWKLNIFIAVILFLIPLGAAYTLMPTTIVGLLVLPALAWIWIGIIIFKRKMNQRLASLLNKNNWVN